MRRRSQSSILSALLVSADNRKWENRSVASLTAVPFRQKISHLFTQIKRHGALFAKGWLIDLQFEVLFSNGLYQEIGDLGNRYAGLIKEIMKTCGYRQYVDSPTNQQFFILPNRIVDSIKKRVSFSVWEKVGKRQSIVRFVTDWASNIDGIKDLVLFQ